MKRSSALLVLLLSTSVGALAGCNIDVEKMEKAMEEGKGFGSGHTLAECETEAFRRGEPCTGKMNLGCQMEVAMFAQECAKVSAPSPELCAELPPKLLKANMKVGIDCQQRGGNVEVCNQVRQATAQRCFEDRKAKREADKPAVEAEAVAAPAQPTPTD